jgi:hypothetical protein
VRVGVTLMTVSQSELAAAGFSIPNIFAVIPALIAKIASRP